MDMHTPGTWHAEHAGGPTNEYGVASTGVWSQFRYDDAALADLDEDPMDKAWICGIWGPLTEEDHANARLIAAAPELLEALNKLIARHSELVCSGDCGFWDVEDEEEMKSARAAIAKAEGRS